MEQLIAKKYAKALMEEAGDKKLGKYLDILKGIATSFEDKNVLETIKSPLVNKNQKEEMVLAVLGKKADGELGNLIRLMAQKNRLDLIPQMVSIIEFEQKKASNSFEGVVYSDEKLSDDSVSTLEKALSSYSGADVKLSQEKSDQPGIKVDIDDLGIELAFSREKVKQSLIDHIQKAL